VSLERWQPWQIALVSSLLGALLTLVLIWILGF
jgi:hypothetical protein